MHDYGSGGFRTHASRETGALIQRLRPLGRTTCPLYCSQFPDALRVQASCVQNAGGREYASSGKVAVK